MREQFTPPTSVADAQVHDQDGFDEFLRAVMHAGSLVQRPDDLSDEERFRPTLAALGPVLGANRAYIALIAEDRRRFDWVADWSADESVPSLRTTLSRAVQRASFPRLNAFDEGRVAVLDPVDPEMFAPEMAEMIRLRGPSSVIGIPLVAPAGIIGFIAFLGPPPLRALTEKDVELLRLFGGFVSMVVTSLLRPTHPVEPALHDDALLDQPDVVALVVDTEARIVSCSPGWTALSGLDSLATLGRTPYELIHDDDQGAFSAAMLKALAGQPATTEVRIVRRDGATAWLRARLRSINGPGPGRALVVGQDITDDRRALLDIHERLTSARTMLDNIREAVLWIRADGTLAASNAAADRLLEGDVTAAAAAAGSFQRIAWERLDESGQPMAVHDSPIEVALRSGEAVGPRLLSVRTLSGRRRTFETWAQPIVRPGALAPHAVLLAFVAVADDRPAGDSVPGHGTGVAPLLVLDEERAAAALPGTAHLSRREWEVLSELLCGYRVPSIARRLFVSEHTVRNHLKAIFRKTGVGSQAELVERLRSF